MDRTDTAGAKGSAQTHYWNAVLTVRGLKTWDEDEARRWSDALDEMFMAMPEAEGYAAGTNHAKVGTGAGGWEVILSAGAFDTEGEADAFSKAMHAAFHAAPRGEYLSLRWSVEQDLID